ncbi:MAG: hypothetical protein OJF52_000765 [Nitrospira sp.]|jgi:hypothetical protein|nr:MAG: hypothetical protein OJF52_000765 [Nitrospira sp.]
MHEGLIVHYRTDIPMIAMFPLWAGDEAGSERKRIAEPNVWE